MKIHQNPNLPHFMQRNRAQAVPQKPTIDTRMSIDMLLTRNKEALDRLEQPRPESTKRASS